MICRTCGRELQNDQAFCPNCGTINDQGQNMSYQTQVNNLQNREPAEQQAQSKQSQYQQTYSNSAYRQVPPDQPYNNPAYRQMSPDQPYNNPAYRQVPPDQPYSNPAYRQVPPDQPYSNPTYRQVPPNQPYPYSNYPSGHGTLPPPLPPNAYIRSSRGPLYVFLAVYIIFLLIFGAFSIAVIVEAAKQTESYATDFNYDWNEDIADQSEASTDLYEENTIPNEEDQIQEESYDNYNYFITGRDQKVFDLNQEISMENNISFLLNEINITDLGDGTSVFVVEINLKSEVEENYFCLDDFLILPFDFDYNMLADALAADYITDADGNELTIPLKLPTEEYGVYTVSFILPMNTKYFTVYGTNYYNDGFAGPVYVCDMEVND